MSMSIGRILVYGAPRIWRRSPPRGQHHGQHRGIGGAHRLVDAQHARMIEARGQREFALEHLPGGLGIRELRVQDLERDVGVAQLVTRAPYLAVAAGAEFFDQHEAAAQLGAGLVLVCHSKERRLTESGAQPEGGLTLLDVVVVVVGVGRWRRWRRGRGTRLLFVQLLEQLAPLAVLVFGGAREAQRVAFDFDHLRRDFRLEALRELLQGVGVGARVGVFLHAREDGGDAAHGAGVARRVRDAAAVVAAAGVGREDAGDQRRGAEHGAGARRGARAHFLLELGEAGLPPAAVRVFHVVVEARVVVVDGVDHGGVALADLLDARQRRIAVGRQAHHLRDAVLVLRRHAGHGIGREILRRSAGSRPCGCSRDRAR